MWGRRRSALLTVCLLTAVTAGCSGTVVPGSAQTPAPVQSSGRATTLDPTTSRGSPLPPGSSTASASEAVAAGRPLPTATARGLPAGVFYLLAGPTLADLNVWQVGPGGHERRLTNNRRGYGIDGFAVSRAGLILAGGDHLARWTPHGPSWLHSRGALIRGSSPDIRANGMIGYVTPPARAATGRAAEFAIWVRRCCGGRGTVVHRQTRAVAGPVFGPHGQVAVQGWASQAGRRAPAVIIYRDGDSRKLRTGIPAIPSLLAWGEHAPAVAVAFPSHVAELLYPDGRRQLLPRGWQPLAWNPDGTQLLMQAGAALGVWSMQAPGQVTRIGGITPGVQILQATWLARRAPL
jgi:hypothetical protein